MDEFPVIQGLVSLEQEEKWEEARQFLYQLWRADMDNAGKLCRILSECWYVLSEWSCSIETFELSFAAFKKTLIEVTEYGRKHMSNNVMFLWMAGYMISLFPYLFYDSGAEASYLQWESIGKDLLLQAIRKDPTHLIAKVFYLGSIPGATEEYLAAKRCATSIVGQFFPGHSSVDMYFKDILCNW